MVNKKRIAGRTVVLGAVLSVALVSFAVAMTRAQTSSRTNTNLYLLKLVEPGYDLTLTEIERGTNYSVLDVKGFVPTVTAEGVFLFRAVYEIAKERSFTNVFLVPRPPSQAKPTGRTEKGRDASGVTKVFMLNDTTIALRDLLGSDYSDNAQALFDRMGYMAVAQLAVLFGGRSEGASAAAAPAAPTAPPRAAPAGQTSTISIVGQWRPVAAEFAAQSMPSAQLPKVTLTFELDGRFRDTDGAEATWVVDGSRSPGTLDLVYTAGRNAGKKQLCVFDVVGDRLTIVFGSAGGTGEDRPVGLTTANSQKVVLFVFERIK